MNKKNKILFGVLLGVIVLFVVMGGMKKTTCDEYGYYCGIDGKKIYQQECGTYTPYVTCSCNPTYQVVYSTQKSTAQIRAEGCVDQTCDEYNYACGTDDNIYELECGENNGVYVECTYCGEYNKAYTSRQTVSKIRGEGCSTPPSTCNQYGICIGAETYASCEEDCGYRYFCIPAANKIRQLHPIVTDFVTCPSGKTCNFGVTAFTDVALTQAEGLLLCVDIDVPPPVTNDTTEKTCDEFYQDPDNKCKTYSWVWIVGLALFAVIAMKVMNK
jgi:hypothetical protein